MRSQKNGFDELLSYILIYEKMVFAYVNSYARLPRPYAHMRFDGPYANAYAQLPPPLRPQCFLMVLTQMLPRGLRLPYAATAPPYARMFSLRQLLRAAYAITTPLHF